MATKLFLRNTQANGIGATYYDMVTTAGSASDTGVVDTAASGTEIQWTKTAGGALMQFVSGRAPAGGFTLTTTDISIWANESHMNANAGGRYRVFHRAADTTETEIGGGPFDDGAEFGTSAGEMLWTGNVTDQVFAEDDRILLKVYITNAGTMGGGHTCTLTFNAADASTGDSFFNIAQTVAFKAESVAYTLPADAGSYAITGTVASLELGRVIAATAGSYAITGTAATLAKGFPITADAGSYAITGSAATLSVTHILAAAAGSYAITGTNASLEYGYVVSATSGSYAINGTDVTLTYSGGGAPPATYKPQYAIQNELERSFYGLL